MTAGIVIEASTAKEIRFRNIKFKHAPSQNIFYLTRHK